MMASDPEKFFNTSPDLFFVVGKDGFYQRVNPAFFRVLGWTPEDLLTRPFLDWVHPEDLAMTRGVIETRLPVDSAVSFEHRYRCKDQTYRTLRWSASIDDDGVLYGSGRDITEWRESYDLFHALIDDSPTAIILADQAGVIQMVNKQVETLFGYARDELVGQPIEILLPQRARGKHIDLRNRYTLNPLIRPMGTGRDLYAAHKNGDEIHVEIGLTPILSAGSTYILSTIIDLTWRKLSEEKILGLSAQLEESVRELSQLATTDSLTQLSNRRAFSEQLNLSLYTAARNSDQVSLMMMDIDNFKQYNDTYGHPAGDRLLVELAQLLLNSSRMDDCIARVGGEEFAVILPSTGKDDALKIAQRYLSLIRETRWPHRLVTTSIGTASIVLDNDPDIDLAALSARLVSEADQALYASKSGGKDRVTHFETLISSGS